MRFGWIRFVDHRGHHLPLALAEGRGIGEASGDEQRDRLLRVAHERGEPRGRLDDKRIWLEAAT
jgi:hypothetical protein